MTLLPSPEFGIHGYEGNAYKVNEVCAHPRCGRPSAHAHHCWPRSYLRGQPYEFVQLPDGTVIGNRLGFCVEHHEMLTGEIGGYRARLLWNGGVMSWLNKQPSVSGEWAMVGPTSVQPPRPNERWLPEQHQHEPEEPPCPTCGHRRSRKTEEPKAKIPARKSSSWTVTAPRDEGEDGPGILDELVEDVAAPLGMSDWGRFKRYHALVLMGAFVREHWHEFIDEVAEATERRRHVQQNEPREEEGTEGSPGHEDPDDHEKSGGGDRVDREAVPPADEEGVRVEG